MHSTSRRGVRITHCRGDRYRSTSSIAPQQLRRRTQARQLFRICQQAEYSVVGQIASRFLPADNQKLDEAEDF